VPGEVSAHTSTFLLAVSAFSSPYELQSVGAGRVHTRPRPQHRQLGSPRGSRERWAVSGRAPGACPGSVTPPCSGSVTPPCSGSVTSPCSGSVTSPCSGSVTPPALGLPLLPVPQRTPQLALGAGWEDSEQKQICPGMPSFVLLARVEPGRSPADNNFPCSWS